MDDRTSLLRARRFMDCRSRFLALLMFGTLDYPSGNEILAKKKNMKFTQIFLWNQGLPRRV
jgi:hypothetical protein